jgi:transcriptional regulator with XRE-family HTH domain
MDNPNEEMFPHEIIVRIFDNEENRLRVFREYRNLSVDELAEKAEVSSSHIRNIENSQRVGTYEVLKKLAEALNLDVEDVGG